MSADGTVGDAPTTAHTHVLEMDVAQLAELVDVDDSDAGELLDLDELDELDDTDALIELFEQQSEAAQQQRSEPAASDDGPIEIAMDEVDVVDVDALIARKLATEGALPMLPCAPSRQQAAATLAHLALAPGPLLDARRDIWRDCVASADACEALARVRHGTDGADGADGADVAYLSGLLHDFGQVLVLRFIEDGVAAPGPASAWAHALESHHAALGFIVAERWQLPRPLPELILAHHTPPAPAQEPLLDVVRTVDAALAVASILGKRALAISDDEMALVPGVRSYDEAAALASALARR